MKRISAILAISIFFCLAGESISGEPTIDETHSFIHEKTHLEWKNDIGIYKTTWYAGRGKGEELCNTSNYEVISLSSSDNFPKIGTNTIYNIRFKELDPTRLDIVSDVEVKASCVENKDCIEIEEKKFKYYAINHISSSDPISRRSYKSKSIYFDVLDRRQAEQLMKALRNMIEKCGGKGELF